MKIKSVTINRFRGYSSPVSIDFDNLLVFVGKNDIGKSTILEALDIFFNEGKGCVKIDKDDINKKCLSEGNSDIEISVEFTNLPAQIYIDATNPTTLKDEYLLSKNGTLKVLKRYPNAGKEKVFIEALHPTNTACKDLLFKKISELQKIVDTQEFACADKTKNAELRKAIWGAQSDLELKSCEIEIAKIESKDLWDKLKAYMPLFTLFQSDRKNSDGDGEIQDPMKLAVREILSDKSIRDDFERISNLVKQRLEDVAERTREKLSEMNPTIASTLDPQLPDSQDLKWTDVFKSVSITADEGIPINKRGSGVKRLILISFFRAEAERRHQESKLPSIIYAIEEPETAQHPDHQRALLDALVKLSKTGNTQVILTTHSPEIVKQLRFEDLLIISDQQDNRIQKIREHELPYPSLNEVNFSTFGEASQEYHNELYGHIEAIGKLQDYKIGKQQIPYIKIYKGNPQNTTTTLTEYIRHQIHHPENTLNVRFNSDQLSESIEHMRNFIQANR
ncbi:ATP-binding protein [Comamonas sp. NyZ500]|uniref:ATP-binding protein n=1 Tax=Comamonas sp. NyZ500 TaxID=2795732 RepID=UPI00192B7200|nr:ATP-binding protein [Comamonas sp. NyZ500]MBL5979361.1 ATP-binding protein [Comamonas sp. NyZ500]